MFQTVRHPLRISEGIIRQK